VKRSNLVQDNSDKKIITPPGLAMTMVNYYCVYNIWGQSPINTIFANGKISRMRAFFIMQMKAASPHNVPAQQIAFNAIFPLDARPCI